MIKQNLIKSLPLVASLLGDALGARVEFGSRHTASTDGKTIYLPNLPADDGEALGLMRGYISHEAGHMRFTDMDETDNLSAFDKHIWNMFEDYLIERRMSERYPGCRHDFKWLIKHIFLDNPDFTLDYDDNPAFAILDFILLSLRQKTVPELIDRVNALCEIVNSFFPALADKLKPLIDSVEKCRTTRDCVTLALRVADLLRDYKDAEQLNTPKQDYKQQTPGEEETDACNNSDDCGQNQGTDEVEDVPDVPAVETENAASGSKTNAIINQALEKLLNGNNLPQTERQIVEKEIGAKCGYNSDTPTCVSVEKQSQLMPLPDDLLAECQRANNALQTKLAALLQARTLRKSYPATRGKLAIRQLYRLETGNPRLFLRKGNVEKIDVAAHILLDRSWSMERRISFTCAACYCVASALSKISGISVALTAFPAHNLDDCTVTPIFRRMERVTSNCLINALGGTPLAEALLYVVKELLPQREKRKIILVLTDGMPDEPPAAHRAIEQAKILGMEVYGIGIDLSIRHLIPKSESITSVNNLAAAMFRILQNNL